MRTPLLRPTHYRHEAVLWRGRDQLLEASLPLLTAAIDAGNPAMVTLTRSTWELIRTELGRASRDVTWVDLAILGPNPARLTAVWLDLLHACGGRPAHGLSEPLWSGRDDVDEEGHIHEATLNVAVTPSTPLWLRCLYDADALDVDALAEARRTHPVVLTGTEPAASGSYAGAAHGASLRSRSLAPPSPSHERLTFGPDDLREVRRFVAEHARSAQVPAGRTDDLVLAINEVAANSIDHGGGRGVVRAWRTQDSLVVEVMDSGHLTDPLAGRINPGTRDNRGRGLWMVNQLCDLVQVRSTRRGTVVRVVTWL